LFAFFLVVLLSLLWVTLAWLKPMTVKLPR
jgi:hypothetical protein